MLKIGQLAKGGRPNFLIHERYLRKLYLARKVLKIGILVVVPPEAWGCWVTATTGRPGVTFCVWVG